MAANEPTRPGDVPGRNADGQPDDTPDDGAERGTPEAQARPEDQASSADTQAPGGEGTADPDASGAIVVSSVSVPALDPPEAPPAPTARPSAAASQPGPAQVNTVTPSDILASLGSDPELRLSQQSSPVTIQSSVVLSSVGGDSQLRLREQPTYIELAGTQLAIYAGGIIAAVTGLITIYWIVGLWMFGYWIPPPVLPTPLPSDPSLLAQLTSDYGRISTSHQAMWDAHQTRVTGFFDTVVARTLLPVLTAILGYIFGAQRHTVTPRDSSSSASSSSSTG